ncbi:MAG TPA: glycerophosphodiester phosphodiesterase [Gemmatimonadaceae bacterium]|nr:glycerophosphodiester phosphodiesterase [Gemmatimonadaceae bacterium]
MSRSPELIGHRGAPRERPENTLTSFLRALDLGADAVELDVHATRDGVVVVHHDFVPRAESRVAALRGKPIADLSAADLETFQVSGEPIPTLSAVLEAVGTRATVYVEIKGRDIERAVIATIASVSSAERVAIHSFDHRAVVRARAMRPGLPSGILSVSYLVDPQGALRAANARDYWQEASMIDESLVDAVHNARGRVIAWTVNDPDHARRLASMGVDGICTDVLQIVGPALASTS